MVNKTSKVEFGYIFINQNYQKVILYIGLYMII